jgi:hypothetical protein
MNNIEENDVKIAVDRAGGATRVSNLLMVSNNTVHTWIKRENIPNIDLAMKLAGLSGLRYSLLRRTK